SARIALARVLAKLGQTHDAIELLRQLLHAGDAPLQAQIELGNAYRLHQAFDDADRAYRAALSLDPRQTEALQGLALVGLARGQLQEAEATIRTALAAKESSIGWSLLGQCLRAQARPDEAAAAFQKSIDLKPEPDVVSKLLITLQCLDGVTSEHLRE